MFKKVDKPVSAKIARDVSMNETAPAGLTPGQRRSNQIKLLILWLIPVVLMGIAGVTYYLVQTGQLEIGSKNKGVLIRPPVQMAELLKGNPDGELEGVDISAKSLFQGKWTMAVRVEQSCDQRCKDALYLTRQLHVRLNKDAGRVQRVYIYGNAGGVQLNDEFVSYLAEEHPRIATLPISTSVSEKLSAITMSDTGEQAKFFFVDPQGWAMMYYLDEHEGNAVLTDLKHLLKYSREQ